ncbi:MAG: hypothetical protein KDC48_17960 [Planctomycetes bacterium]|nr:hypothetical protein [Planctomycetota bacterium]
MKKLPVVILAGLVTAVAGFFAREAMRRARDVPITDASQFPAHGVFAPPVQDGDAVFFVGNSLLGWEGRSLPEWVAALGMSLQPPLRLEVGADIVFGNAPLADFLGHAAVQEALASRRYKVFVLQGEECEAVDDEAGFHQAVRDFHAAAAAAGASTVLFMTWEMPWRGFLRSVASSYEAIARELQIPVIPVGLVHWRCDQQPPTPRPPFWLTSGPANPEGGPHPNAMGAAVNAYAVFQALTGIDPKGVNFAAPGNDNDGELMRYFSDMAWKEISPRLRR